MSKRTRFITRPGTYKNPLPFIQKTKKLIKTNTASKVDHYEVDSHCTVEDAVYTSFIVANNGIYTSFITAENEIENANLLLEHPCNTFIMNNDVFNISYAYIENLTEEINSNRNQIDLAEDFYNTLYNQNISNSLSKQIISRH